VINKVPHNPAAKIQIKNNIGLRKFTMTCIFFKKSAVFLGIALKSGRLGHEKNALLGGKCVFSSLGICDAVLLASLACVLLGLCPFN